MTPFVCEARTSRAGREILRFSYSYSAVKRGESLIKRAATAAPCTVYGTLATLASRAAHVQAQLVRRGVRRVQMRILLPSGSGIVMLRRPSIDSLGGSCTGTPCPTSSACQASTSGTYK